MNILELKYLKLRIHSMGFTLDRIQQTGLVTWKMNQERFHQKNRKKMKKQKHMKERGREEGKYIRDRN